MSARIPQTFIDDLMARIDIVDLIDSRVPLKKSGRNHVARCPFHSEKTPSFTVNREKQLFHCFGCGASGTAISFLMDYDHLGFIEAVEDLAQSAGVEMPRREASQHSSGNTAKLDALYELQKRIATFFSKQLSDRTKGQDAVRYLKSRGVDGKIARDFLIGYSLPGWNVLSEHFSSQILQEAGLLIQKDNGKSYDRFRNRIMFPIRDKRGRVVGFGGRVLDDSLPKYLNSPETTVFQKGNQLYGLYELLAKNSRPERILVVEGYMDVVALAQNGVSNSVATLGTAVSRSHLEMLFRVTREVIFCFDGDEAGKRAAWKAVEMALPLLAEGKTLRIMLLPLEHDPDSFIRQLGYEAFVQAMTESALLSDYFFEYLGAGLQLANLEDCANLVAKARPLISQLRPGVFRDMMEAKLRELARVDSVEFNRFDNSAGNIKLGKSSHRRRKSLSPIRVAISLIMHQPSLVQLVDTADPSLTEAASPGIQLFLKIADLLNQQPHIKLSAILERFRGSPEEVTVRKLAEVELIVPKDGIEAEFRDALSRILEQENEKRTTQLLTKAGRESLTVEERNELRSLLPSTGSLSEK